MLPNHPAIAFQVPWYLSIHTQQLSDNLSNLLNIAVNFHTSGNLLLAAGHDKVLRFFRVDGDKNEKQLSVRFSDMAILSAQFVPHSSEVLLGGRKPYFYCYDTESGSVRKVSGLAGKNIKSHEKVCYCYFIYYLLIQL